MLTAHPTEVVRRTLLQTHRRIADALAERDRPDLTPEEADEAVDALRREIATIWQTDEVRAHARVAARRGARRARGLRADAVGGAAALSSGRSIARSGEPLPLDAAPLRFGSWIGGDRDGNPNVTPEVTRKATWMARWVAADLYAREIEALRAELSIGVGERRAARRRRRQRRTVPRAPARRRARAPGDAPARPRTRIEQDGALDADGGTVLLRRRRSRRAAARSAIGRSSRPAMR